MTNEDIDPKIVTGVEKIIPPKIANAVIDFVEKERKKFTPERRIRRAVFHKWKIKM